MAVEAVKIVVRGRVQGVWFRASAKDAADSIGGIAGWVRNKADGNVELYAEGERDRLDKLIEWCREGPSMARVFGVDVTPETPKGMQGPFRITY